MQLLKQENIKKTEPPYGSVYIFLITELYACIKMSDNNN